MQSKSIYDDDIVNGDKFTSDKWKSVEKPLDERERKTNEMIMNYGDNVNNINKIESMSDQPVIIGEIYYMQVRSRLNENKILIFDDIEKIKQIETQEKKLEREKKLKII
jgi:hypothetical protein